MDSATSLMRTLHRAPESEVLKPLLNRAASTPDDRGRIVASGTPDELGRPLDEVFRRLTLPDTVKR